MRGLLALVIGMGVLIVAGVVTVGVTVMHRMTQASVVPPMPMQIVLDEPAGTRIMATAGFGDRLAVTLQGGGADRIVVVDGAGRQIARIRLTR